MEFLMINPINNTNYLLQEVKTNSWYKTNVEFINIKNKTFNLYGAFNFVKYDGNHIYFYTKDYSSVTITSNGLRFEPQLIVNQITYKLVTYSKESIAYQFQDFPFADIFSLSETQEVFEQYINPLDIIMRLQKYVDLNKETYPDLYNEKYVILSKFGDHAKNPELPLTDDLKEYANYIISKYKFFFSENNLIKLDDSIFSIMLRIDQIDSLYDYKITFPRK